MNILIIHHDGKQILSRLETLLKGHEYLIINREEINFEHYTNKDLVIVIGGDGTFLRASHFNHDVPMFGINPIPNKKEGFFMHSNVKDFERKMKKILKNETKVKKLLRLCVHIKGKILSELALNEVFIGDAKPYNMFNYDIKVNDEKEFQRSSGLLIGTPSGSNAWIKSAGGKVLDLKENKFQYIIRDLFEGKLTNNYKLRKGLLTKDSSIEVTVKTPGILVMDSVSPEYKLEQGDKVEIGVAKDYLSYVKF